jgi:fructose transport system permease protein
VILTAGIDLSVGTVMACGQIGLTKLAIANGGHPLAAIAVGIAACVACGLLNGALVTGGRLPAVIGTLGTFIIAVALTHVYSDDLTFTGLPSELLFFGRTFAIGGAEFTYGTVLMLVLFGAVWYSLTQTAWGRHVYAVGDNAEAARLTGIKTNRVLLSVYGIAGLMYGIAAMLLVARTELGDPNAGQTTENLDSITAVVLGGTSLFGCSGSVIGSVLGALLIGLVNNGLILMGLESSQQIIIRGGIIILAVALARRH